MERGIVYKFGRVGIAIGIGVAVGVFGRGEFGGGEGDVKNGEGETEGGLVRYRAGVRAEGYACVIACFV